MLGDLHLPLVRCCWRNSSVVWDRKPFVAILTLQNILLEALLGITAITTEAITVNPSMRCLNIPTDLLRGARKPGCHGWTPLVESSNRCIADSGIMPCAADWGVHLGHTWHVTSHHSCRQPTERRALCGRLSVSEAVEQWGGIPIHVWICLPADELISRCGLIDVSMRHHTMQL